MTNQGTLDLQVRNLLDNNPSGLTVERLRTLVQKGGTPAPKHEIVATLFDLARQGAAGVGPDRKWRARVNLEMTAAATERGRNISPLAGSGQRLLAMPASVSPTTAEKDGAPLPEGRLEASPDLLTKLIPYYRDALRAGDVPGKTALSLSKHGAVFGLLRPHGAWWPIEGRGTILRIAKAGADPQLLKSAAQRVGRKLLIGYPCLFVQGHEEGDSGFLRPISTLRCDFRLTETHLELHLPALAPALNPDWIKSQTYRQWTTSSLRTWLQHGDSSGNSGSDAAFLDFETLCRRLRDAVGDDAHSSIDPWTIARHFDVSAETGVHNVMTLITDAEGMYTRGALGDFDQLTKLPALAFSETALGSLFGEPGSAFEQQAVLHPLPLGETQLCAARAALSGPLTVIKGPPGTGKSQVIASIMVSAAAAGRRVLFASRNHKALDAVEERLEDVSGEHRLLTRAKGSTQEQSFSFSDAARALQSGGDGAAQISYRAHKEIADLDERRWRAIDDWQKLSAAGDVAAAALKTVESLEARLAEILSKDAEDHENTKHTASPDVEVIRRGWLQTIWAHLAAACGLDKIAAPMATPLIGRRRLAADLRREIGRARSALAAAEADVQSLKSKLDNSSPDPVAITETITALSKTYTPKLASHLRNVDPSTRKRLLETAGDHALLKQQDSTSSNEIAQIVLNHLPLWAVTTLAAATRIPLKPGLFDYVIFDEAAQVDIASALPLLYRAKAAVIVGDPEQLTMIPSLPVEEERDLLRRHELLKAGIGRYAQGLVNLFDFVSSAAATRNFLLTEHFRCHPEIAGYINEAFYGRKLTPLTDVEGLRVPAHTSAGLHWSDISGEVTRRSGGSQTASAKSDAEAEAVVLEVERLLSEGYEGTIGIVTFFEYQARTISSLISSRIPAKKQNSSALKVFTTHKSQGDERDVILFSLCMAPSMTAGAKAFIMKERRLLNVSVSRARAVCHVFGDREYARRSGIPHIEKLVRAVERKQIRADADGGDIFDSPWEKRLHDALVNAGFAPIPQYPIGGRRLDLALLAPDGAPFRGIDIEVDGVTYHQDFDGERKSSDLWRDHQIRGLGWRVLRFWVYELRDDMEECIERIRREFRT